MKILLPMWLTLRRKRGFTIIELLVASVILVILFGSITAVFLAANRSWTQTEARLQIYQNARNVLNQMSREIATAFPSSDSNKQLVLTNSTYTVDATTYDDDQLTFAAAYNFNPGSVSIYKEYDLTHLGYRLNTTGPKLERYKKDFGSKAFDDTIYDGSTLANEPAQTWKEMALYVISLNFEWYNPSLSPPGFDDTNDYNNTTLPSAVRITIKVQDKQERYEPKTFQNVVYLSASQ